MITYNYYYFKTNSLISYLCITSYRKKLKNYIDYVLSLNPKSFNLLITKSNKTNSFKIILNYVIKDL